MRSSHGARHDMDPTSTCGGISGTRSSPPLPLPTGHMSRVSVARASPAYSTRRSLRIEREESGFSSRPGSVPPIPATATSREYSSCQRGRQPGVRPHMMLESILRFSIGRMNDSRAPRPSVRVGWDAGTHDSHLTLRRRSKLCRCKPGRRRKHGRCWI